MKELEFSTHFSSGGIEEINIKDDDNNFRWVRKVFGVPNGLNYLSSRKEQDGVTLVEYEYFNGLILKVTRSKQDGGIKEKYTLTNPTEKPIEINSDYSISISFADDSDIVEVALNRRAYMQLYFFGNCFCVYNSRFNGSPEGVGLVLTNGNINDVKINRIPQKATSVLNCEFANTILQKDQEIGFEWLIFGFENSNEFVDITRRYQPFPLLNNYCLFEGDVVKIDTEDTLFVDGTQTNQKEFVLSQSRFIRLERGDRYFEFLLSPTTGEKLAKQTFCKGFKVKQKHLDLVIQANQSPNSVDLLQQYFKCKPKHLFDLLLPMDVIYNNTSLKDKFIDKVEYALQKEKGYYYIYNILAKQDFLSKALLLNDDVRYQEKLSQLQNLTDAFFRLNPNINFSK